MILTMLILFILTVIIYTVIALTQHKKNIIWLNPMLITILVIAPLLLYLQIDYSVYLRATQSINFLIEPAVVALGYPLYKQLQQIKKHWKPIVLILSLGVLMVIFLSFIMAVIMISSPEIAISLSLKSVTNPIGIALTKQLHGNTSVTAIAIIIAGLFGALLGPSWLKRLKVASPQAQGLAIGAASHVIGTAAIAKHSAIHGAYGSIALIVSALLTSLISPLIIPVLVNTLT